MSLQYLLNFPSQLVESFKVSCSSLLLSIFFLLFQSLFNPRTIGFKSFPQLRAVTKEKFAKALQRRPSFQSDAKGTWHLTPINNNNGGCASNSFCIVLTLYPWMLVQFNNSPMMRQLIFSAIAALLAFLWHSQKYYLSELVLPRMALLWGDGGLM